MLLYCQPAFETVTDDDVRHWNVECGKKLTDIQSSSFCNKTLLTTYCEFLRNFEVYFTPNLLMIANH